MTINIHKLGVSLMVVIGLEGPPGQLRAPSSIASPKMKKERDVLYSYACYKDAI